MAGWTGHSGSFVDTIGRIAMVEPTDERPLLDYHVPVDAGASPRQLIGWIASVTLGAVGGVVLANSDVGAFCAAVGAGAFVPIAAGAIAERRRVVIGLAGNLSTVLVCLCWVFARSIGSTGTAAIDLGDALKATAVVTVFVVIPGLVASGFVALIETTVESDV